MSLATNRFAILTGKLNLEISKALNEKLNLGKDKEINVISSELDKLIKPFKRYKYETNKLISWYEKWRKLEGIELFNEDISNVDDVEYDIKENTKK